MIRHATMRRGIYKLHYHGTIIVLCNGGETLKQTGRFAQPIDCCRLCEEAGTLRGSLALLAKLNYGLRVLADRLPHLEDDDEPLEDRCTFPSKLMPSGTRATSPC